MILERTDFSARIAYVDYDGKKAFENYRNSKPKSHSEKLAFVQENAPRIISGIKMIEKFFYDLRKNTINDLENKKDMLCITS